MAPLYDREFGQKGVAYRQENRVHNWGNLGSI